MAKDQHGCRFLQRKFSEGTLEDIEKIFVEIIDHIVELMTDPFGNYLVQKLLEVCNEDQRMQILQAITRKAGDLVRISCDMHGLIPHCLFLLFSYLFYSLSLQCQGCWIVCIYLIVCLVAGVCVFISLSVCLLLQPTPFLCPIMICFNY